MIIECGWWSSSCWKMSSMYIYTKIWMKKIFTGHDKMFTEKRKRKTFPINIHHIHKNAKKNYLTSVDLFFIFVPFLYECMYDRYYCEHSRKKYWAADDNPDNSFFGSHNSSHIVNGITDQVLSDLIKIQLTKVYSIKLTIDYIANFFLLFSHYSHV